MTEKRKIFLKKEKIDIVFSILPIILLVVCFYYFNKLLDIKTGTRIDDDVDLGVVFLGFFLMVCLGANILLQTILNILLVSNTIKSLLFFITLVIGVLLFGATMLQERGWKEQFYIGLFSFALFFIKFLIAKYYYKTLNKINTL